LIGNPGVGKTFLAKLIAWRACQINQRVLFTTAMDMLNHLLASHVDHSLVRKLKTYTEPALLVCDECEVVRNVELTRGNRVESRVPRFPTPHFIGLTRTPASQGSCGPCPRVCGSGVGPA